MDTATLMPLVSVQTVMTELLTEDQLAEAVSTFRGLDGSEHERKLYTDLADHLEGYGRRRAAKADDS